MVDPRWARVYYFAVGRVEGYRVGTLEYVDPKLAGVDCFAVGRVEGYRVGV